MTDQTIQPTPAPAAPSIEERFTAIAEQLTAEITTLQTDLQELMDLQGLISARVDKLEAAGFVTNGQFENFSNKFAETIAPKIQPTVQPVISVTDTPIEERVRRLEGKLRHF